jgi:hypothetical protein
MFVPGSYGEAGEWKQISGILDIPHPGLAIQPPGIQLFHLRLTDISNGESQSVMCATHINGMHPPNVGRVHPAAQYIPVRHPKL